MNWNNAFVWVFFVLCGETKHRILPRNLKHILAVENTWIRTVGNEKELKINRVKEKVEK
jgi:hypothetical protein